MTIIFAHTRNYFSLYVQILPTYRQIICLIFGMIISLSFVNVIFIIIMIISIRYLIIIIYLPL